MSKAKWLRVAKRGVIFSLMLCCLYMLLGVVSAHAEPLNLTPDQLMQAYEDNEVIADNDLVGKVVRLSGEILKIERYGGDQDYIEVTIAKRHEIREGPHIVGFYDITEVHCYFYDDSEDIALLKKGKRITVEGPVLGRELWYVGVGPCHLVE